MNKYLKIITELQKKESLTAKELSKIINCSDRSIRNYILEINSYKPIIMANSKGYYLSCLDIDDVLSTFTYSDVREKELYIIESLLLSSDGLSIYELQEILFVSAQTINTYIKNINKQIRNNDLKIIKRKDFLYLSGDEENKRILFKENLRINNYDAIEKELNVLCKEKNIDFSIIRNILIDNLDIYHIHVNDYSLLNILTHLIVKILRVNAKNIITNKNIDLEYKKYVKQIECANQICNDLEKRANISFSKEEINSLSFLLISKSNTNYIPYPTNSKIDLFVLKIIDKIKSHYGIDLYDTEFVSFFTMHLRNLLKRVDLDNFSANPLFEQVINFNSLVYDIAVFVTSELKTEFNINLPEEEIAFLSFHIGSIVVKKNILDEDIYIAIESFDFYKYAEVLKEKLVETLPNYIHIEIISNETTIPESFLYDLIITTTISRPSHLPSKKTMRISALFSHGEIELVKEQISIIKNEKNNIVLKITLNVFLITIFSKRIYL